MIKEIYLKKIADGVDATLKSRPVLLGENNYGRIYGCNSSRGELIIKIGFKEGVEEKIPGLGKKRLANEFLFSSWLTKNKVIPKIIKFDQSNKLITYPYIIYKKIIGDNLARLTEKNKISFKCLVTAYGNMGKELKLIHKTKFNKFGDLNYLGHAARGEQSADWYEFFFDILGQCLNKVKGGYFGRDFFMLREYVAKNMLLMKDVKIAPTLLHGDFEPWNIIVNRNNISGIIDSEFAFSGHNLMDLTPEYPWALSETKKQILRKQFLKGYFGKNSLSSWQTRCLDFYQDIKIITHRMVVWDYFVKTIDKKEKTREEKRIKEMLEEINIKLND